jgi:iron complex outermembrane receptor protein
VKIKFYHIFSYTTLLFFFHFSVNAQKYNASIRGRILNNDGKPAQSVTVELQRLNKLTFSDNDGSFIMSHLQPGNDSLIISSTEFKTLKLPVLIKDGSATDIGAIHLQYNIPELQSVEIKGRTLQSYKSDYSFFVNKTQTPSIDIPQSVSSVTKELIADKMAFNLKDVVGGVAGVNQYSGYDEYTIRGFRAENSRDINGLRGYNTTYTNSMLVNIERVEIIKGPASTLYGNGDPGGTINLVTKKPLKQKESEINIYGGTWNHFRVSGDNTGPLNKKKTLLYRINAGYDNTKSFRDNYYSKAYQVAPSLSFIPNDRLSLNIDFSLSHINTILDRGQPGILDDANLLSTPIKLNVSQPGDYLHETDLASTVSFSYKINDHLSFNVGYLNYITQQNVADHGLENYITNDSIDLYFTKWEFHTVTNTISNYFSYKFNTGKLNHQMVAGYDYIQSKINLDQNYFELTDKFGEGSGIVGTFSLRNPVYFKRPTNSYKLSDYDSGATEVDGDVYHTQGAYLQDEISLNRWKVLLGVREEFYKGEGGDEEINQQVFLPRVGLVYAIKDNLSAYATYNKGFDPFEASSSAQQFDEPLKPQISELLETGIKANFFSGKLSASFAVYQLSVQNVAVNANEISNPDLFVQQGKVRSRGVELEADGNVTPNLSASFAYAFCEAKITKSKTASQIGTRLENAPRNSGSSWLKYDFKKGGLKGFGISAGYLQAGARNTLDPLITLPGYIIFNGAVQYSFQHFTLALRAENIFNKTYWMAAYNNVSKWPGEPRNIMVNLRYKF